MLFIARELREYMARLGIRTIDELVGRTDLLKKKDGIVGPKGRLDLSDILAVTERTDCIFNAEKVYDFKLEETLDESVLLKDEGIREAVVSGKETHFHITVGNTDRTFGTLLGAEITRNHPDGLADDTITLHCTGTAGQSFGAFIPAGLTIELTGDANDYLGKGLSADVSS